MNFSDSEIFRVFFLFKNKLCIIDCFDVTRNVKMYARNCSDMLRGELAGGGGWFVVFLPLDDAVPYLQK